MTLKQELSHLESAYNFGPDVFNRKLGIALRSAATQARQNKLVKHFNISQRDIESIIKSSYL